jgi:hypothetical protein
MKAVLKYRDSMFAAAALSPRRERFRVRAAIGAVLRSCEAQLSA